MSEVRFEIVPNAAQDLVSLPEDKATGLLDLFRKAGAGNAPGVRTVYKGLRGTVVLIRRDDMAAEALVDPSHQSFTVVSVQRAADVDPEHATANLLSDIEPADRPQAIPLRLGSVAIVQKSLRRLLDVYGARPMSAWRTIRVEDTPQPQKTTPLIDRLFPQAQRWKMREARNAFKDLLESAQVEPQVIERDGKEYLVIERALMHNFEQPLDAAELAAKFSHRQLPLIDLTDNVPRHAEPELTFTVRATDG